MGSHQGCVGGESSPPSASLCYSSCCRPQCPRKCCWLTFTLLLTRPSRSFPAKFLKNISSTCSYYTDTWGYHCQGAKLHILWLNFMKLFSASLFPQLVGVHLNGRKLSHVPTPPPSFVSSADLLSLHSAPLSMWLMKTLRSALVPGAQL